MSKEHRKGAGIAGLGVFILTSLIVFVYLALEVFDELSQLRNAESDNVQWTLPQAEFELLQLQETLYDQLFDQDADLQELRTDFDIFYSRVTTLSEGKLYVPLMKSPDFAQSIELMQQFLERNVGLIDGPDDQLRAGVVPLLDEAHDLRPAVRNMAITGLSLFAEQADQKRADIRQVLISLAIVALVMLCALLLLALLLVRENRHKLDQAEKITGAFAFLDTIFNTSLDAIIVADIHGKILRVNTAAEEIFGWSREHFQSRTMSETIVPPKYRQAHEIGMARLRASGKKHVVGQGLVKLEAQRADGSIFPVEMSIQEGLSDSDVIYVASLRDISAREKAENELVQARDQAIAGERTKTEFIAVMSHELRTPLNGLLGTLALMRDTSLNERQKGYLRNMETSGAVLLRHINDVLDITKYEAGHVAAEVRPVDLDDLVQSVIDNQHDLARARNNSLGWKWCSPPVSAVMIDPGALWQVLLNLVGNAVKFTKGGSVEVELEAIPLEGDRIELEMRVIDTGQGIAPNDIARMFEDFETADKSYKRTSEGSGLGLGIARRIVSALGGEIGAESEKGEGSVFWVRLPMQTTATVLPKTEVASVDEPTLVGQKTVLVVEDSEINRAVLRDMLEADGHQVTEAVNGMEGVAMATDRRFDLILMDISMPVMDGIDAKRCISSGGGVNCLTPVVATTAHAMPAELELFRNEGFSDYLTKPIERAKLRQVLASVGGRPETGAPPELERDVGLAVAQQLIGRFREEAEETLAYLRQHRNDPAHRDEIVKRAHRLAGAAGIYGYHDFRQSLQDVETLAQSGAGHEAWVAGIDRVIAAWNAIGRTA